MGVPPQDAPVKVIGFPPPAALGRASALPSASTQERASLVSTPQAGEVKQNLLRGRLIDKIVDGLKFHG